MRAYYNEHDPFAAEWLRILILEGHIAPGDVDERSIEDVLSSDLAGYTQCHFFAGIGVWSYALRRAGWSDDRPVWTGSCPCQPFSAAGKGSGFADERHLWPAFFHLIGAVGPERVLGEQVASKNGLAWLDLVQTDMEATGYAFGALDLCAAGVGAPHIRQRSFWMAHQSRGGRREECEDLRGGFVRNQAERLAARFSAGGGNCRLDDDDDARPQGHAGDDGRSIGQWEGAARPIAASGLSGGVADRSRSGWREECANVRRGISRDRTEGLSAGSSTSGGDNQPGPTNGFWRDADWLGCRDGKWRPVESGTFPLAHGVTNRVGALRGYGNAIVAPLATAFIEAVMSL